MKKTILAIVALAIASVGMSDVASAKSEAWAIDKTHSEVGFAVRHFFAKTTGRFTDFEGTIEWDPDNVKKTEVDVTIQVASVDTANEGRDKHLRGEDFFDVETYPTMKFVSKKVKPMGKDRAKMTGLLTLHGVTRPVTLDVEIHGHGPDPWGGKRAGFSATGVIDRQDYGVSWNKVVEGGGLSLGNEVEIRLEIEAMQRPEKAK